MKKEVYQCLMQLEALSVIVRRYMDKGISAAVINLSVKYQNICNILKEHLSEKEFENIGVIQDLSEVETMREREGWMRTLYMDLEMTIAYLNSFDMTFDKEVKRKEQEFEEKEAELKIREKTLEQSQKVMEMLLNPKTGLPELIRSGIMKGVKENHRGIEKNTNPNTKSQKKKP